jgi:predicted  nucleic acid-binding Zn-ribbon protein
MKSPRLKVTCVGALTAALCFSSTAFATPGDQGGPPQSLKQCRQVLRGVDAALVWENKRYAKAYSKLAKTRAALQQRSSALTAVQTDLNTRMETLRVAIEDQANPLSQEDADRMVAEYNSLFPTYDAHSRSLQTIHDTLEGLKFDFSELKKTHRSNVASTVKYRKQVASFCHKFKK